MEISHKNFWGITSEPIPELDETELVPPSFPDRGRFLALAPAEVIQLGATNAALLFYFDFRDPWRMQRENPLDAFAVRNSTHGEGLV